MKSFSSLPFVGRIGGSDYVDCWIMYPLIGGVGISSSEKNKKKIKEAAALQYNAGEDKAPRLLAAGKGEIAEKILETAKENSIPVYKDPKLSQTLSKLGIGDEVPPELYEVVAEILVFVANLDRSYGEKYGRKK